VARCKVCYYVDRCLHSLIYVYIYIGEPMTKTTAKIMDRKQTGRLCGERSLVAAVIGQAVDDATGVNGPYFVADARAYFASSVYDRHLAWLDKPDEWIPEHDNGHS